MHVTTSEDRGQTAAREQRAQAVGKLISPLGALVAAVLGLTLSVSAATWLPAYQLFAALGALLLIAAVAFLGLWAGRRFPSHGAHSAAPVAALVSAACLVVFGFLPIGNVLPLDLITTTWALLGLVALTYVFAAWWVGDVAAHRGRSRAAYLLLALIALPVAALIVLLTPATSEAAGKVAVTTGAGRKCPFCAEVVKAEAIKCRYCGSALVPEE
jgi:hypothetical protein